MKRILTTLSEKWPEYLIEAVVIIASILGAYALDNWNEDRKNQEQEIIILNNLKNDLEEDIQGFNRAINDLQIRKNHVDSILYLINTPDFKVESSKLVHWMITSGYIIDYQPVYPTYNEILGAGLLSLISNTNLKNSLAEYKSVIEFEFRIMISYDENLKKVERKVNSYFSKTPPNQYYSDDFKKLNQNINVDIKAMRNDAELIELLRHISYHSQVEIVLKKGEFLTLAETIIDKIENELNSK